MYTSIEIVRAETNIPRLEIIPGNGNHTGKLESLQEIENTPRN